MTRDEVCQEFGAWYHGQIPEEVHWSAAELMADEIVRLREILAAKCPHCGEQNPAEIHTCTPWETRLAAVEAERENVSSQLHDCENERDGLRVIVDRLRTLIRKRPTLHLAMLDAGPCVLCGYDGPTPTNPDVHPCEGVVL